MRPPHRHRHATLAALCAGVLITTGCGRPDGTAPAPPSGKELRLQPVADRGVDPFTASTAAAPPRGAVPGPPRENARGGPARAAAPVRTPRALPGTTPGLYAGSASASCDVKRQIELLTADPAISRAFAGGAGSGTVSVPGFLRALTPVVLRADIRVTDHGYRDGAAAPFQSVLQAGTAVMVDDRGMPRVRCASGSPLGAPVAAKGSVTYRGERWPGYRSERVVVVHRAELPVDSLVIVGVPDNAWVERRTGTDGGDDAVPAVPPPYAPDADITDPEAVKQPDPVLAPPSPAASTAPRPNAPAAVPGGGDRRSDPLPDAGGPVPPADDLLSGGLPADLADPLDGGGLSGADPLGGDLLDGDPVDADLFDTDLLDADLGVLSGGDPLTSVPDGEPGDVLIGPDSFQG
ncbi:DUF6777 domain-containing protein [Streptomyces sp. NPDC087850]|uniref:DUF6777 domain-containing protein n=1 Tax=unclassified Streptomyces TaxID=2593676 RepID=UPI003807D9EB